MAKKMTQKERILEFVRANPLCTARQIQDYFDFEPINITMSLYRLRREDLVCSVKINGTRRVQWIQSDMSQDDFAPQHKVVTEWTGHARDEWHRLFYGAVA